MKERFGLGGRFFDGRRMEDYGKGTFATKVSERSPAAEMRRGSAFVGFPFPTRRTDGMRRTILDGERKENPSSCEGHTDLQLIL